MAGRFDFAGVSGVFLGRHGVGDARRLGAAVGRAVAAASVAAAAAGAPPAAAEERPVVPASAQFATPTAAFSAAAAAAVRKAGAGGTCFRAQLEGHAAEDAVTASTVFLAVLGRGGKVVGVGSGVVVRGSGTRGSPLNKILTATHVAASTPPDGVILALDSRGGVLGPVQPVVTAGGSLPKRVPEAAPWLGVQADFPEAADIAVVALAPTAGEARRYRRIPGLDLAPVQADEFVVGAFGSASTPAPAVGASGGPLVDRAGQVHGVLTAVTVAAEAAWVPGGTEVAEVAAVEFGAVLDGARDPVSSRPMQRRAMAFFSPVGAPEVLAALGAAGAGVRAGRDAPSRNGALPAAAVGYSGGRCVVSAGVVGPGRSWIDRPASAPPVPAPTPAARRLRAATEARQAALSEAGPGPAPPKP